MASVDSSESRRPSRRGSELRGLTARDAPVEQLSAADASVRVEFVVAFIGEMLTSNQFQRRSPRKKSDAAETLEQTKVVHLVRSHRCALISSHQAADAKEADPAPSVAGNKRMFHPDPLKPEQAEELGISGVAKDDNVFLVDKILDERYAKNVRAPSRLGT